MIQLEIRTKAQVLIKFFSQKSSSLREELYWEKNFSGRRTFREEEHYLREECNYLALTIITAGKYLVKYKIRLCISLAYSETSLICVCLCSIQIFGLISIMKLQKPEADKMHFKCAQNTGDVSQSPAEFSLALSMYSSDFKH